MHYAINGLKKSVRYTEDFIIWRFVKSRFYCMLYDYCKINNYWFYSHVPYFEGREVEENYSYRAVLRHSHST